MGRFGVSNPRSFVVGDLPEVTERSSDDTPRSPMPLRVGQTVNGRANIDGIDVYQIELARGQRVLIDCSAQRIDSRMDATLALYDASGRKLAMSRDHNRRDPLLEITAPADGHYQLKVYDFIYSGGEEHFYRVSVRAGPYIDFVFPPSGLPGSTASYTLFGRHLSGGGPLENLNGIWNRMSSSEIFLKGLPGSNVDAKLLNR